MIDSSDASVTDAEWNEGKDWACSRCEKVWWSHSVYPDEPIGMNYEQEGYALTDCLDSDIFVLKSPYYTLAQFCSPCVPGAGNLDNPIDGGVKTYALGHDWFEGGMAPYSVYRVSDGVQIIAKRVLEICPNCNGSGRDTILRLMRVRQSTRDEVHESIVSGETRVDNYNPIAGEFNCFRCDGKGRVSNVVELEKTA